MQEMWVPSLGQEDPLEKEMQPPPVLLPGKFHGQRSLVGSSPWGHKRASHDLATKQNWSCSFICRINVVFNELGFHLAVVWQKHSKK